MKADQSQVDKTVSQDDQIAKMFAKKELLPPNQKHHWKRDTPEAELFKSVCKYFEDCGLSDPIKELNDAVSQALDTCMNQEGNVTPESLRLAQSSVFRLTEISNLLIGMYETTHMYHYSGITFE